MPRHNHMPKRRKNQKTTYNPTRKQQCTYSGPQEEYEYGF